VADRSESVDGLALSRLSDSDGGGGDNGGASVYVSCEGVEGCDNVVWMGKGGQSEDVMKWEMDNCRMSTVVAGKVLASVYGGCCKWCAQCNRVLLSLPLSPPLTASR